ncbi:MAG TPA: SCO family protein [Stellaceae bacterium]|nr:SCO family protein [Stellaceae bacterium]
MKIPADRSRARMTAGPGKARVSPRLHTNGSASSVKLAFFLVFLLAAYAIPLPAFAYILGQVQQQLHDNEEFFQIVNSKAAKFTLRDAEGQTVGLGDFKGKVVVLDFLDGHCTDLCPLLSDLLAKIQGMIDRTPLRRQVQFVSISINPTKDTLPFMKKYGQDHGFDPRNWVFLTTLPGQPENATRQLARGYGQEFTEANDGDFLHGLVTDVIDPEGMLRGKFYGLKFQPADLIAFAGALANDIDKRQGGKGVQAPLALVSDRPAPVAAPVDYAAVAIPATLLALATVWLVVMIAFLLHRKRAARRDTSEPQWSGNMTAPPASDSSRGAD